MDRCDNCRSHQTAAYTLTAHTDADHSIDLTFCSADCLRHWTGTPRQLTVTA